MESFDSNQRPGFLLGMVEVLQPMRGLSAEERVKISRKCREAVMRAGSNESGLLGKVESGSMGVEVVIDRETVQVLNVDYLVSQHKLGEVSALVAVRGSNGHVVLIGNCQKKRTRVALVLDMSSEKEADQLIKDYQAAKDKRNTRSSLDSSAVHLVAPSHPPRTPTGFSGVGTQRSTLPDSNYEDPDNCHSRAPPPLPPPLMSQLNENGKNAATNKANPSLLHRPIPPLPDTPKPPPLNKPNLPPLNRPNPPLPDRPDRPNPPLPYRPNPPLPDRSNPQLPGKPDLSPLNRPNLPLPDRTNPPLPDRQDLSPLNRPNLPLPDRTNPPLPDRSNPPLPDRTNPPLPDRPDPSPLNRPNLPLPDRTNLPPLNRPKPPPLDTPLPPLPDRPNPTLPNRTNLSSLNKPNPSLTDGPTSHKSITPTLSLPPLPKRSWENPSKKSPVQTPKSTKEKEKNKNDAAKESSKSWLPFKANKESKKEKKKARDSGSYDFKNEERLPPSIPANNDDTPVLVDIQETYNKVSELRAGITPSLPSIKRQSDSSFVKPDDELPGFSDDDDDEEDEQSNYANDEVYYLTLGINVEDSERIYMKRPAKLQGGIQKSLQEDINYFLTEEHKYLSSISRICEARISLPPQLQHLLRGAETLSQVHHDMYEELYDGYESCSTIAQVFLSHKQQLEPYKYYLMKAPIINSHIKNLSPEVMQKYPSLKEDIQHSWKRIHFYFMSLEKMLGSAPEHEKPVVQNAVDMLRELNRQGDSGIIMDAVQGCPFDLHIRAPLLLHNSFKISSQGLSMFKKKDYRVLLFAEMLVVTLPKADKYDYEFNLRIEEIHFVPGRKNEQKEFVLEEVLGGGRGSVKYTFRAPTKEVTDVWVEKLTQLFQEHVERVKDERSKRFNIHVTE